MMTLWEEIRSDYRRYRATGAPTAVGVVLFTQGFWATTVYRVGRRCHQLPHVPVLSALLHALTVVVQKAVEILSGIALPVECEVGPGLFVAHFGPTVINGGVRIGRNCNLSQGVSIGVGGRGAARGCPVLGDRVFVGPNAVIFGRITIGDDAAIGAGAIVTKSVPLRGVVAGNPARLISLAGSFDFVMYDDMDNDSARRASLAKATTFSPESQVQML